MRKDQVALALAVVVLAAATLACSLPALTTPAPTPTPTVPPTPTDALSQATPVSAAEPANALEAQVETVYDQAGPAVVNITSRVITYDLWRNSAACAAIVALPGVDRLPGNGDTGGGHGGDDPRS